MIRPLKVNELGLLENGAHEVFAESGMLGKFDFARFCRCWSAAIRSGTGVILGMFGQDGTIHGAIGGLMFDDFNTPDRVGSLTFWYVRRHFRGRGLLLLKALEQHM